MKHISSSSNNIAKLARELSTQLNSFLASLDNEGKTNTPDTYTIETEFTLDESDILQASEAKWKIEYCMEEMSNKYLNYSFYSLSLFSNES